MPIKLRSNDNDCRIVVEQPMSNWLDAELAVLDACATILVAFEQANRQIAAKLSTINQGPVLLDLGSSA